VAENLLLGFVPPNFIKMSISATDAKIRSIFENRVLSHLPILMGELTRGDMYGFEEGFFARLMECYNEASQELLSEVSRMEALRASQRDLAQSLGAGKLVFRDCHIQLRTGFWVKVKGLYAKKVPEGYEGTRHMLHVWWSVMEQASPAFYSLVCLFSVLCCSYDVAKQVLTMQHVKVGFDRMRLLANRISSQCIKSRSALVLDKKESLAGKRVFISLDGGRTRTRVYLPELNKKGTHHKFETPWKEPKMLVINILDKEGKNDRHTLPVYDVAFGDDEVVEVLRQYLSALHVEQAEVVQIAADGAPWIWNRVKPMLLALEVPEEKIVETVDFYHAVENLNKAIGFIPLQAIKDQPNTAQTLKKMLWKGKIKNIVTKFKELCPHWDNQTCDTILGYFIKNEKRMKYQQFKEQNLPCGSGSMESAIRRVICLRFKCPSSFWKLDNLEGMIFLRSVLLAKRWDIFINNLARCPH